MFTSNQTETLSPWTDALCGVSFLNDHEGAKAATKFYKEFREFCATPKFHFCHEVGANVIAIEKKGENNE